MAKTPVKNVPRHIPTPRVYPPRPPAGPPEVVHPLWLLKAVGVTILGALLCAYLTLCLLVYQGQWQLVLHPSDPTVGWSGPLGEDVRFGAGETGQPRLAGKWIAADPARPTILYLPDGNGALASDAAALRELSSLPVNVLGLDYRGFGASDHALHPSEARMQEDAEAALDYLVNTRHVNVRTIVPYGVGLGGALAVQLAVRHGALPGVIVEDAVPDALAVARHDSRSEVVPLRWLFHERFEIAAPLRGLKTPKLLLTAGPSHVDAGGSEEELTRLYKAAALPSLLVHLPAWQTGVEVAYLNSVRRFLDETVPAAR